MQKSKKFPNSNALLEGTGSLHTNCFQSFYIACITLFLFFSFLFLFYPHFPVFQFRDQLSYGYYRFLWILIKMVDIYSISCMCMSFSCCFRAPISLFCVGGITCALLVIRFLLSRCCLLWQPYYF